jgi:hypothetical protein
VVHIVMCSWGFKFKQPVRIKALWIDFVT